MFCIYNNFTLYLTLIPLVCDILSDFVSSVRGVAVLLFPCSESRSVDAGVVLWLEAVEAQDEREF